MWRICDFYIIIDNNTVFSYDDHLNLSKKIIKYFDPNTKDIITKKIKPKNIKFPFLDFIFLSDEEKEKYFSPGNISYTYSKSKKQNNNWPNESKNQFINKKINNVENLNTLCINDDNNIYGNLNSINERNHNLFDFKDLDELIKKSIKHIMLMRPFYSKLESIPLKKIELDYFKKELEKNALIFTNYSTDV